MIVVVVVVNVSCYTTAYALSLVFSVCQVARRSCMYVCILWAGVQSTLDPYAEAFFIAGPLR